MALCRLGLLRKQGLWSLQVEGYLASDHASSTQWLLVGVVDVGVAAVALGVALAEEVDTSGLT